MTLEDPFFVVKEEVCKALTKTRGLYARWSELQSLTASGIVSCAATPTLAGSTLPILNAREELEWTTTELRNALRSIEWDIEDLDDTICIVEKNPSKFKIDNKELTLRRNFIEETHEEVKIMKDKMNISKVKDRDRTARQPLHDSPAKAPPPVTIHGTAKYSKLENESDSPNRQFQKGPICNQNFMLHPQDEQMDSMSNNTGTLKTVSRQLNSEFDERQVMLDDVGNEMEVITETKLDATMKKMAKVLHMSNGNYNNYVPAPTTSAPQTTEYVPKPCSLSSLSSTITNCFLCSRD